MAIERDFLGAAVVDDVLYAIGGYDPALRGFAKRVEAYQSMSNAWIARPPMIAGRMRLAAASLNGVIYAMGGYNYSSGLLNEAEAYMP